MSFRRTGIALQSGDHVDSATEILMGCAINTWDKLLCTVKWKQPLSPLYELAWGLILFFDWVHTWSFLAVVEMEPMTGVELNSLLRAGTRYVVVLHRT